MCCGSTVIVPVYHHTIAACNQQKLHFNFLIFFWANTLWSYFLTTLRSSREPQSQLRNTSRKCQCSPVRHIAEVRVPDTFYDFIADLGYFQLTVNLLIFNTVNWGALTACTFLKELRKDLVNGIETDKVVDSISPISPHFSYSTCYSEVFLSQKQLPSTDELSHNWAVSDHWNPGCYSVAIQLLPVSFPFMSVSQFPQCSLTLCPVCSFIIQFLPGLQWVPHCLMDVVRVLAAGDVLETTVCALPEARPSMSALNSWAFRQQYSPFPHGQDCWVKEWMTGFSSSLLPEKCCLESS